MTDPRPPRRPAPRPPERTTPRVPAEDLEDRDPMGRMALFSDIEPQAPPSALVIECSSCLKATPVSPLDVLKSALPVSFHLPFVKHHHSFMRCPACGHRTWVRLAYRP